MTTASDHWPTPEVEVAASHIDWLVNWFTHNDAPDELSCVFSTYPVLLARVRALERRCEAAEDELKEAWGSYNSAAEDRAELQTKLAAASAERDRLRAWVKNFPGRSCSELEWNNWIFSLPKGAADE